MINYVAGTVEYIEDDMVVVDNNGIGLGIYMPTNSLEIIGIGEQVIIYTYLNVKEDDMQLFGFLSREELKVFKMLIGVSGVGPRGGLNIISTLPNEALQLAIISGDDKAIAKSPGIGKKTAQKIIIELKDKLDLGEITTSNVENKASSSQNDAIEALVALGYSQSAAFSAIGQIEITEDMDVEEILKLALKKIM